MKELAKQYDPSQVEDRIYQFWLDGGYFHTKAAPDKKPYTIVMPPPNVTGQLHMGHAVDNTMQDILIRTKRMQGYAALWVPGTDHASIATEAKVVEAMRAEGLTKEMVGRDGFLERAWAWKTKYGNRIVSQLKKLGSSCDWERERFTMDEGCSEAVKEVFVRLYDKGPHLPRPTAWSTGAPTATPPFTDAAGGAMRKRTAASGTCSTRSRRPARCWSWLPPVPRPCWAIPPLPSTAMTPLCSSARLPRHPAPAEQGDPPSLCDEHADMTKGTGVVKITPAHDPQRL